MKNLFRTFLIVLAVSSFSFTEAEQHKIHDGKGIDEDVLLGETTREQVIAKYGDGFTETRYYTKSNGGKDSTHYSTLQRYEKLGVGFYYKAGTNVFFSVSLMPPFNGVSDKGIVPGVSTMTEVVAKYGSSEWYTWGNKMFLEYDGIKFYVPFNGKFPIKSKTQKKALKEVVREIIITVPGS